MPVHFEGDIVITGISGRLPESSNIEEFKENLMKGIDMVTEDDRRWPAGLYGVPPRSGKIKNLNRFDASFFKVHAKQARAMDPQLRLLLEVTYEALIDAGINPSNSKKSRTGVFVGVSVSDANNLWKTESNEYRVLGCLKSMFANRISYAFDFIGPSCVVDTACSSSLTAMHQAVIAIRSGECDSAIIGGLQIMLDPANSIHFHKLNMLSKDGKCKTFDATANGYVRSEAVIAMYLQKTMDARRIYAKVIGTATNTDGYKPEGIMYPNNNIQYLMLRELYNEVGIDPRNVVYVEAHGTGTQAGDSQEVNAIDRLFCKDRKTPLLIGSVKSNIGHTEPASGLCSIAKVLIAMETGVIPANLHFAVPNPNIPALTEGRIRVIDKATPWNGGLVGINSFGFGGTNAHVILDSNPKINMSLMMNPIEPNAKCQLPKLVAVSGRTKEAVHVLLDKASEHRQDNEFLSLLHAIHSNNISGHNIRGYEILAHDGIREITQQNYDEKCPIWFVFSGMGSQWSGMGRELLNIEICHQSLSRCADVLKSHDIDLMNIIMNGTDETYEIITVAFVSIVAIQIALVDMLTSIGIKPDGIVGHSIGELSCSYADGAFTLEQTILAAYYRGKSIVDSDLELGDMAAVGLNWEETKKICPSDISLACHNSADLVTISGPSESVHKFVEVLKNKDIFVKMVKCSGIAFHSIYLAPIEFKLRAMLDIIIPKPKQRSDKWISSSIPETAWNSSLAQFSSSEYFVNNMLSPVLFKEAIAHIPDNAITIEIAPHCLLQAILRRSLPSTVINVSLQKQNHSNNLIFLLSNVGKMYMAGAQPDILKLYSDSIISFPVGRGTPMIGPLIKWDHSSIWEVPVYKHKSEGWSGEHIVEINLFREADAYLAGHKIEGRIILPGFNLALIVWKTFAKLRNIYFEKLPVIFENIWFQRITFLPEKKPIKLSVRIFEETGDFIVREVDSVVFSGNIRAAESIKKDELNLPLLPIPPTDKELLLPLSAKDVYTELKLRGYEHSGYFKGIKSCDNYCTEGEIFWFNEWSSYIDNMFQFNIISNDRKLVYGSKIRYVQIDPVLHKQLVDKLPKDGGLPVYQNKKIDIIKSGGILIRGINNIVSRRQHLQTKPKYKRYTFVPYESSCNLNIENQTREKMHALTVLLQIMCENLTTFKINAVEIVNNQASSSLLKSFVLDIIHDKPLFTINVDVKNISDYIIRFNQMNMNIKDVMLEANDATRAQNVHLFIAANVLSEQSHTMLKNLAADLRSNCFILLEETTIPLDLKSILREVNLTVAGKQIGSSGKIYLLLKKRGKGRKSIVVYITERDFSWLENAKTVLRNFDSKSEEVLFVSQGEESSGLIGFINSIRHEVINVRYVFIQDSNAPKFDLSAEFYAEQLDKELSANVLKEGQWGSYRYLQLNYNGDMQVEHACVNILKIGDLSSLKWIQSPLTYYQTKYTNTLCSVYYASLNFKDVMLATGKLSTNTVSLSGIENLLGIEFSGRDANGNRVMGIVKTMGLATTVLPDTDFLWEVPDKWTLEQAATIPVVYAISYYALFVRGQLKAGESVLIHCGASGVGQAAIAIALHAGCTVFTTVGTLKKRLYLRKTFPQLTDKHIGNSRDTSFEQLILNETEGYGVNVVLNSLEEEKLHASVRCLATNGRFLEIGKYNMLNGNRIDMSIFIKNIVFYGIHLETLYEDCADKQETIRLVSEGIENGVVRPLPTKVFQKEYLEQGFKFMTTGKHIGKILLKIRDEEQQKNVLPVLKMVAAIPRTYMNPEKSYILIGGLGGFGLELTNWMIDRGARFIILVSRSGIRTGYQAFRVRYWRERGIKIIISTADITTLSGAEHLIDESNRLAPVGGIFNLAAVLHDGFFENLQIADFEIVTLPKINGTRNLDATSKKSCPSLDYFVVFSSISSGHGNPGQSNYCLANSAMERMMEQRRAAGLPGLAIQWGSIKDIGLYEDTKNKNIYTNTILKQNMTSCLETMDIFLQQRYPVLLSMVIAEKLVINSDKVDLDQIICNILGIENVHSMTPDDNFEKLGMDSLAYMEIKQILERDYNIMLSFREMRALTVAKIRDLIAERQTPFSN
ncbi:fatty acid synthase-like isoform X2 [Cataglyphis hispanica]|nr:fatty acid synthase-like isoform X2 [Cataglyphis hispanica]XP_050463293.1 fatty acid synthase-like isoform X2 [Cataglyphis hispanica]XP_050463302.1 fatty acid synthase-like isoform X2 [Cataglyphis hispanica]XP_050463310.1 fatty acid synthase-like isoform X2 [Cataglyphis hispanica]XP_050463319.1 fatty acid synthase-like isoform X2 [Cataglyphis hispanica]